MKKLLLSLLITISISTAFINIIDNRDYPDDGYEIYIFNQHIGYYYSDYNTFDYTLTGKTL